MNVSIATKFYGHSRVPSSRVWYLDVGVVVGRGRLVEVWRQVAGVGEGGRRTGRTVTEDVVGGADDRVPTAPAHAHAPASAQREVVGGVAVRVRSVQLHTTTRLQRSRPLTVPARQHAKRLYECPGPPYNSRIKIYAARMSRGSGSSSYRSTAPSAARARPQQQTRRPLLLLLSIDGTDRRTDRQTDTRPFYDNYCILRGRRKINSLVHIAMN